MEEKQKLPKLVHPTSAQAVKGALLALAISVVGGLLLVGLEAGIYSLAGLFSRLFG